jgi:hypothetical protein
VSRDPILRSVSAGRADVLAALLNADCALLDVGEAGLAKDCREARAAVAELIAADAEHDSAREALIELNRRIAEQGWIDLEHDALRHAGERFVRAQSRRYAALVRVQP